MRIKAQGAANDLHVLEERYHDSRRKLLMNPKKVRATQNPKEEILNGDATVQRHLL